MKKEMKKPVVVHFSWMGAASDCNFFKKEGFPVWKTVNKDNP
jgi:hypothetical protein